MFKIPEIKKVSLKSNNSDPQSPETTKINYGKIIKNIEQKFYSNHPSNSRPTSPILNPSSIKESSFSPSLKTSPLITKSNSPTNNPIPSLLTNKTSSINSISPANTNLQEIKPISSTSTSNIIYPVSNTHDNPKNTEPIAPSDFSSIDPILISLLESPKDRLFILEIENKFIDFINGNENQLVLPPYSAYRRKAIHNAADYYHLRHVTCQTKDVIVIYKLDESTIPPIKLSSYQKKTSVEKSYSSPFVVQKIMKRSINKPAEPSIKLPSSLSSSTNSTSINSNIKPKSDGNSIPILNPNSRPTSPSASDLNKLNINAPVFISKKPTNDPINSKLSTNASVFIPKSSTMNSSKLIVQKQKTNVSSNSNSDNNDNSNISKNPLADSKKSLNDKQIINETEKLLKEKEKAYLAARKKIFDSEVSHNFSDPNLNSLSTTNIPRHSNKHDYTKNSGFNSHLTSNHNYNRSSSAVILDHPNNDFDEYNRSNISYSSNQLPNNTKFNFKTINNHSGYTTYENDPNNNYNSINFNSVNYNLDNISYNSPHSLNPNNDTHSHFIPNSQLANYTDSPSPSFNYNDPNHPANYSSSKYNLLTKNSKKSVNVNSNNIQIPHSNTTSPRNIFNNSLDYNAFNIDTNQSQHIYNKLQNQSSNYFNQHHPLTNNIGSGNNPYIAPENAAGFYNSHFSSLNNSPRPPSASHPQQNFNMPASGNINGSSPIPPPPLPPQFTKTVTTVTTTVEVMNTSRSSSAILQNGIENNKVSVTVPKNSGLTQPSTKITVQTSNQSACKINPNETDGDFIVYFNRSTNS
ncbi:hypothetical protein AYI69_g2763 [Smittium culicis]|uniref:R3H domain-containing protein n=1 Tax=Smittium culicis TaxID=133412 RepID=A0A1R1YLK8_9FUNG|nr:hypothetical protein AYI69_g2763 [Smittium culicis]